MRTTRTDFGGVEAVLAMASSSAHALGKALSATIALGGAVVFLAGPILCIVVGLRAANSAVAVAMGFTAAMLLAWLIGYARRLARYFGKSNKLDIRTGALDTGNSDLR